MHGLGETLASWPLFVQARAIWLDGGWAMIALAINAFVLFAIGFNMWIDLRGRRFRRVSEKVWRGWISDPSRRKGSLGELITFLMSATSLKEMRVRYDELRSSEVAPYSRDLKFMRRAVSTAPLLGLLGTVTGMLATFNALALGAASDKTMEMIAGGISEALITTETGLVIALPGLFFQYHLARERDHYETFIAHVHTACTQYFHRSTASREPLAQGAEVRP